VERNQVCIPRGYPRDAAVRVINGDGGNAVAPKKFALYEQSQGCFNDHFTSGSDQWIRNGEWNITTLANGQRVMTDSPQGSYTQASQPDGRLVTSITSHPISLEQCQHPVLRFRHDYALAIGNSQDLGRVELSQDGGNTWVPLETYSGYRSDGAGTEADATSSGIVEWADEHLQEVQIDLGLYSGTVLLRFSLDVDYTSTDRGWVIDDVSVADGNAGAGVRIYLPFISRP
jgi:hypothetical protein